MRQIAAWILQEGRPAPDCRVQAVLNVCLLILLKHGVVSHFGNVWLALLFAHHFARLCLLRGNLVGPSGGLSDVMMQGWHAVKAVANSLNRHRRRLVCLTSILLPRRRSRVELSRITVVAIARLPIGTHGLYYLGRHLSAVRTHLRRVTLNCILLREMMMPSRPLVLHSGKSHRLEISRRRIVDLLLLLLLLVAKNSAVVWIEGNALVLLCHYRRVPLQVTRTVYQHLLMHLLFHAHLVLAHHQTLVVPLGLGIHVIFASHRGSTAVVLLRHDVHCVTHVLIGKLRLLAHLMDLLLLLLLLHLKVIRWLLRVEHVLIRHLLILHLVALNVNWRLLLLRLLLLL